MIINAYCSASLSISAMNIGGAVYYGTSSMSTIVVLHQLNLIFHLLSLDYDLSLE